jgi:hypothetical protein
MKHYAGSTSSSSLSLLAFRLINHAINIIKTLNQRKNTDPNTSASSESSWTKGMAATLPFFEGLNDGLEDDIRSK